MHNWYVEDVANRRMRYERERAAQARTLRKPVGGRAAWRRAWLAAWLRRLSSRPTHAGALTRQLDEAPLHLSPSSTNACCVK